MRVVSFLSLLASTAACAVLAGCETAPLDADADADSDYWSTGSAPAFMDPTADGLSGHGCSFSTKDWNGTTSDLLEDRWADVGSVQVGDAVLSSPEDYHDWVTRYGPGSLQAERATLALNLALNEAQVYGMYALLGEARLTEGPYAGSSAGEIMEIVASTGHNGALLDAIGSFNDGFAGCPEDWYFTCHDDEDNDGIIADYDCNDFDADVGQLLYEDDLSSDAGYFDTTPQLDGEWVWGGTSVYSVDGGQQALLGEAESWDDYVVYATVAAKGTMPGCGFECEEACGEYEPDDGCYSDWQALGLGILSADITADGVVTFYNTGDWDVCFEGYLMWDAEDSQGLTIGEEVLENESYRVPAGGSLDVYYGSWTTDNGYYSPYLDEAPLWCYQAGTSMATGTGYASIGALLPEDMQYWIAEETDTDGDGTEDHVDWADSNGVQTQYNLWDYQEDHAAVVVGKLAESTPDGTVEVTLTAQNRGALSATATLEDTVPTDWGLISCTDTPDTEVQNTDGSTTLTWDLSFAGCTDDCSVVDEFEVTCEIEYNLNVDLDIVELDAASIDYFDGDDDETSWSMPAAAFDYDHDSDGAILCGESDRWRAGVLARAELDDDQDEGYHGYRCALSSNAEDDCYDAGHFLQIAEFMDAPEDDIPSECWDDCPENTTFDQLARVDHAGDIDLKAGDSADLAFWAVGDALMCEVDDGSGGTYVRADATDTTFTAGTTGFSTLNMFGDFDHVMVCEAYDVPAE